MCHESLQPVWVLNTSHRVAGLSFVNNVFNHPYVSQIVKSHSRPHVRNDNPCSEAGFKTLNNTARPSRPGSARSRMPGPSARTS